MGAGSQVLGHGGCGTVFKAVHEGTRTLLALKEINAMDKTSRDQMLNEVSLRVWSTFMQLVPQRRAPQ
jgi:serine/threonine protein kinase